MPGKPLTDVEIGQIEAYRNCGKGVNEIARILKRNRKTVSCFIKKWDKCGPGETPAHKKRPGRNPKINDHASRIMKRAFLKSPRKSCKELKIEHSAIFQDVKLELCKIMHAID